MKWTLEQKEELRRLCLEGGHDNKGLADHFGVPVHKKGLAKEVRKAFDGLYNAVLLALACDWTSLEETIIYSCLAETVLGLQQSYDDLIGGAVK